MLATADGLKEEAGATEGPSVTWKSCGLSDSSFLGGAELLFLLPPGWWGGGWEGSFLGVVGPPGPTAPL